MAHVTTKYLIKDHGRTVFEADCLFSCMDFMREGPPTKKLFMVDGEKLVLLAFRKPLFEGQDGPDAVGCDDGLRRRRRMR